LRTLQSVTRRFLLRRTYAFTLHSSLVIFRFFCCRKWRRVEKQRLVLLDRRATLERSQASIVLSAWMKTLGIRGNWLRAWMAGRELSRYISARYCFEQTKRLRFPSLYLRLELAMKSHGAKNAAAHLHSVDRMCSEIRSAYGQLFVPYLNRWGELALFGGRAVYDAMHASRCAERAAKSAAEEERKKKAVEMLLLQSEKQWNERLRTAEEAVNFTKETSLSVVDSVKAKAEAAAEAAAAAAEDSAAVIDEYTSQFAIAAASRDAWKFRASTAEAAAEEGCGAVARERHLQRELSLIKTELSAARDGALAAVERARLAESDADSVRRELAAASQRANTAAAALADECRRSNSLERQLHESNRSLRISKANAKSKIAALHTALRVSSTESDGEALFRDSIASSAIAAHEAAAVESSRLRRDLSDAHDRLKQYEQECVPLAEVRKTVEAHASAAARAFRERDSANARLRVAQSAVNELLLRSSEAKEQTIVADSEVGGVTEHVLEMFRSSGIHVDLSNDAFEEMGEHRMSYETRLQHALLEV